MRVEKLPLSGAAVIDTEPLTDHRGLFARFFCEKELSELIGGRHFVNVNFSKTHKIGAIRGLHFQRPPQAEMKFVRCIRGAVYDVIVDIRRDSPTFLKWFGIELSSENLKMLCVPEGFAHGFQVLKESSEMLYLHSEFYSKEHEGAMNYFDPVLAITWPLEPTDISERDKNHKMIGDDFQGVIL